MIHIMCIHILEGLAYLAAVIDICSCRVVGWSMRSRQITDVAVQALDMAVWRHEPKRRILIHADQGSQSPAWTWPH